MLVDKILLTLLLCIIFLFLKKILDKIFYYAISSLFAFCFLSFLLYYFERSELIYALLSMLVADIVLYTASKDR